MSRLTQILSLLKKRIISAEKNTQKTYAGWVSKNYDHSPTVSFIIQSHNRSANVLLLIGKLRTIPNAELIVIDDGSTPNHTLRLVKCLTNANEFLLRCNDLYEVITYSRAMHFARGKYVALLQDDDDFETTDWVNKGINHLEQDSLLVILGGRDGARLLPILYDTSGQRGPFIMEDNMAYRANSFNIELSGNPKSAPGLTYVQYVDRAPMWIRRDLFLTVLHDFDTRFAPFQWDDAEVCLRAWTLGLHVGHYPANFSIGGLGAGGMQLWNSELHQRQDEVNVKRIYDLYADKLSYIDALVEQCNSLVANS